MRPTSSLTNMTAVETAARIRSLNTWPRWPWLPLKRTVPTRSSGGGHVWRDLQTGVIYADDVDLDDEPTTIRVFDANVHAMTMRHALELTNLAPGGGPIPGARRDAGLTVLGRYDSVEHMLAAGWRVD